MPDSDRYAVMGNPIGHSKSPQIHRMFAEQTGEDIEYEAMLVERDGFADAVHAFRAAGGKGLNVTVPFKEEAWALADRRSDRAQSAGAANTLLLKADDGIEADNTDGVGMVRDLEHNLGVILRDRRILILGAGGAVRGVLLPVLATKPARVMIANRTASKAIELAELFQAAGPILGGGYDALEAEPFDLIINGTAAGLSDQVPPIPTACVNSATVCYDMMYSDKATAFQRWAREQGAAQAFDGLGMLVEQAAESFFRWRGVRPQTDAVIRALRDAGQ